LIRLGFVAVAFAVFVQVEVLAFEEAWAPYHRARGLREYAGWMRSEQAKSPLHTALRIVAPVVLQPLEYLFDRDPFRMSLHRPGPVVRAYWALTGRIQTYRGRVLGFALANAAFWLLGVLAVWGTWLWIRVRRRKSEVGVVEAAAG
jgi:hypothetical protein